MRKCAAAGYPIRAVVMPIIPVEGWESIYADFLRDLIASVPIERLTLGGICSYRDAHTLMDRKLGARNDISDNLQAMGKAGDGRIRYAAPVRTLLYKQLVAAARRTRPDLDVALCLEERALWEDAGLADAIGRCNCVL